MPAYGYTKYKQYLRQLFLKLKQYLEVALEIQFFSAPLCEVSNKSVIYGISLIWKAATKCFWSKHIGKLCKDVFHSAD